MFFGLAMFAIVVNQAMSHRMEPRVQDQVRESQENIQDYLYDLSQTRQTISLHGEIYQLC